MDNIDVSFVVPIYNVPINLLKECCNSFLNNVGNIKYEVLLIDDGSKNYVQNYLSLYKHSKIFRYFKKKNGGVSDARNFGIERCKGKYICFVDPDDKIEMKWCQAREFKLVQDIYFFDYEKVDRNYRSKFQSDLSHTFEDRSQLKSSKLFEGILKVSENHSNLDGFYLGTPWGKLFKRSFIKENNLKFDPTLRKRQDALFCAQAYLLTDKISLLIDSQLEMENTKYFYLVENEYSITKNYNDQIKNIYLHLFASMERLNDIYQLQLNEALSLYSYDLLKELINLDFCNVQNKKSYNLRKQDFLSFRENRFLKRGFKKIPYKTISIGKKGLYFFEKYKLFFGINLIYIYRKGRLIFARS